MIGEGILLGRLDEGMRESVLASSSVPPALQARCLQQGARGGLLPTAAVPPRARPRAERPQVTVM